MTNYEKSQDFRQRYPKVGLTLNDLAVEIGETAQTTNELLLGFPPMTKMQIMKLERYIKRAEKAERDKIDNLFKQLYEQSNRRSQFLQERMGS